MRFKATIVFGWISGVLACSQSWAAPVISDFSPIAGSPGDHVQLTGSGFNSPGIAVRFWNGASGVLAPVIFVNSDTVMTISVPSGISTGPISIQQGTSQSFTANDFLAIGTGPYISSVSPPYGSVNDTVTIDGVHLANTTGVL